VTGVQTCALPILFQHAYKGNYVQEFDAAERQYSKIQNIRFTYKCI
jgi:hypothetical protein